MDEKATAVIPARGMNDHLLGKNAPGFGKSSPLIHKIRQLKQMGAITEVIVSSEDNNILTMVDRESARAIKRPYEYSAETLPFQDFLCYIAGEVREGHVMWACYTPPVVGTDVYRRGYRTYFEKLKEGYDLLVAVVEYHHYPLDKDIKPYTFKWESRYRNSRDLDKLYFSTDDIQLASEASTRGWYHYFDHSPYGMEIGLKTPTDIDTIFDYLLVRMQYHMDDDATMTKGTNSKDSEAVCHYVFGEMVPQLSDEKLAKALTEMPDGKRASVLDLIK